MASGSYSQTERKRPSFDESPSLPAAPVVSGPLQAWAGKLLLSLGTRFARFGIGANVLALLEDQDKLRMRFFSRG